MFSGQLATWLATPKQSSTARRRSPKVWITKESRSRSYPLAAVAGLVHLRLDVRKQVVWRASRRKAARVS